MKLLRYFTIFLCGLLVGSTLCWLILSDRIPNGFLPESLKIQVSQSRPTPSSSTVANTTSSSPRSATSVIKQSPSSLIQGNQISQSPILMYHYIRINPEPNNPTSAGLSVSPANFEEQMAYLYAKGYKSVTLNEVFSGSSSPQVAITFDDGYKDAYTNAYPILRRLGYKATVFVIVDKVGTDGYLNWNELKLLQNEGWSIGSHTLSHPNLSNASRENAVRQIVDSKSQLEEKLGKSVDSFCYPSGQFNDNIVSIVTGAGYQNAVTTLSGVTNIFENRFKLKRVRVKGSTDLEAFAKNLRPES